VLLVAPPGSYRIQAYVAAARRLELELTIVSEGRHSLVPDVARGVNVDFDDPRAALGAVRAALAGEPVGGVVSTDDATAVLASTIAAGLGIAHSAPQAVATARRKDLARRALDAAGIPGPEHRTIDLGRPLGPQLCGVRFPCVVKPLALSASRGVIRADDAVGLRAACERAARITASARDDFEATHLLIEDFIPGREVAV